VKIHARVCAWHIRVRVDGVCEYTRATPTHAFSAHSLYIYSYMCQNSGLASGILLVGDTLDSVDGKLCPSPIEAVQVFAGAYLDTHTHLWLCKFMYIYHVELPVKLLDYFLRSNKSNINQWI